MIAGIRRIRLLALLLLAGTPGLGGVAVQALHPCPAEMPWLGGSAGDHAHHGGGDQSPGAHDAGACHCIGSCSLSAPAGTAATPRVHAHAELLVVAVGHGQPAPAMALLPIDRFPPKTAPPLLG